MAAAPKEDKNIWITRSATGQLFRAVTLSTDPGQTLRFTESLINLARAQLISKLENMVPDHEAIPGMFLDILRVVIVRENDGALTQSQINVIDGIISKVFQQTAMARYSLPIYRDIIYCDELLKRWKEANQIYVQSPSSWAISNSHLADINTVLMEIIVRHDLMVLPKSDAFNLDAHSGQMSDLMKMMQARGVE